MTTVVYKLIPIGQWSGAYGESRKGGGETQGGGEYGEKIAFLVKSLTKIPQGFDLYHIYVGPMYAATSWMMNQVRNWLPDIFKNLDL